MKRILLFLFLCAFFFQASASVTTSNYRWRNNDGSEASATWKNGAAQSLVNATNGILRLRVQFVAKDANPSTMLMLMFRKPDGTDQIVSTDDNDFMLAGSGSSFVSEGQSTTPQLGNPGRTFTTGQVITSTPEVYVGFTSTEYTEYEWVIKGGSTFQPNTTYTFFLYQFDQNGIESSLDLGTVTTASSTLPLKLLSFEAKLAQNKVQLQWKTAEEINVDRFEIEKSHDGKSFLPHGNVQASAGSATKAYAYTDHSPSSQDNYYRLKIVDKDGTFSYSQVSRVKLDENKAALSVFPNPAKDKLNISLTADAGQVVVALRDVAGRTIKTFTINSDGRTLNKVADISSLQRGIYFISLNDQTVRFVKD